MSKNKSLETLKNECASEVGVHFESYNGDFTARQCGSVGGQMVKKMVSNYKTGLK